MDEESKNRLTDRVQDATAENLQTLTCPACGGGLSIQYTSRGKSALSVMCGHCMWRVIRDGLATEPLWVRELGPKIQTAKKAVEPPVSQLTGRQRKAQISSAASKKR